MSSAPVPVPDDAPDAVPDDARPTPSAALIFDDPLDRPSSDDTDEAWGDRPSPHAGTSDLARFLDEKPPHHL